jgi:hypothetical protein
MRPTSHKPRLKAGNCVLHPDKPEAGKRPNDNYQWARHAYPRPNESRPPEPRWLLPSSSPRGGERIAPALAPQASVGAYAPLTTASDEEEERNAPI